MYPPIFIAARNSAAVRAALGDPLPRMRPFGQIEQDIPRPYAVWQVVSGSPENYLAQVPDMDQYTIQIDVYGTTADSVRQAAKALRDAVERYSYVTRWGGENRDTETQLYRISFDVDWFVNR